MADNCVRTPGSGESVAADEITDATLGSCKAQYVKLMSGTLDSTEKIEGTAAYGLEVDVVRLPALVAGSAAIGKLAANSGVDIGDVDVLSLPALAAGSALIGKVKTAELGNTRVSKRVAITASATGTAIWTPTSGWRFVLTMLWVSAKTAGDIEIFDNTDSGNTVVSPITTLNVGGGYVIQWAPDWPYRSAAVNNVLKFTTGTVITGSVYVEGWEENA